MFSKIKIPKNPGCYLFKDKKDRVLYVGKAKNLKNRIKTYENGYDLDPKTRYMLNKAVDLDFIVTDNEVEALILENTLIKKYKPKYNIRLKDAKSHSYIKITDEKYPRALISRRKVGKEKYYGPFVSASERDYILHFIKKTFNLRTCKKLKKKPCLRHHIDMCDAPCAKLISKNEYDKKIRKVKKVLSGKTKELINELEAEMEKLSNEKKFELAIKLRNEIFALKNLNERQNMKREKRYNEDILNFEIKDDKVYLMLFNIYKGTLNNKNEFIFEKTTNFLDEFIVQYYSEKKVPKEIIIPEEIDRSIEEFLSKKKGSKVKINVPQRGEKKQLLELVLKNIELTFFSNIKKPKILQNKLKLKNTPNVIECFDISHLSGTSTVGSMVQFRNGKPDKNNYRRFKIRTVDGIDDFEAISEVVRRRYKRLKNENRTYPDLIIIDGGRGQLNFSIRELEKIGVKIPIISVAKKFEEIYIPGKVDQVRLSDKDKALHYIQEIRNEAHRFAIKYNRLLRRKELIQ